jgi:hypothetical protein
MASIVQFLHPGGEHGPDPRSPNFKSWNRTQHLRKFMTTKGKYVSENGLVESPLCYWAEWEPPSHVREISQRENSLNPRYLHTPALPETIPFEEGLQNTDPYIFDGPFKYLLCRQFRQRPRLNTSRMTGIPEGSLILFGSNKSINGVHHFLLDTVIVVKSRVLYNPRNNPLTNRISRTYNDLVYTKAFQYYTEDLNLTLYMGATFKDKIDEMFSFVPSKIYNSPENSFQRISVPGSDYIAPGMNTGFNETRNLSSGEIREYWNELVRITRDMECLLGVEFSV